jgi:TonB family protein
MKKIRCSSVLSCTALILWICCSISSGYEGSAVDAKGVRHTYRTGSGTELPFIKDQLAAIGPNYPFKDRTFHHEGNGVFRLTINMETGSVANVTTVQSTGFKSLDDSAVSALRKWRWEPNTWKEVEMPVYFEIGKKLSPNAVRLTPEAQKYQPVLSAPKPRSVKDAAGRYLSGNGFILVDLDWQTGAIKSIQLVKSSGNKQLDDSVLSALRKWKFRPATTTPVRIPFSFDENGKVELGARPGREEANRR